jgi:hypothetical protein
LRLGAVSAHSGAAPCRCSSFQAGELGFPVGFTVRDIRRATRRHHSAEEKICIVLEGPRGEDSIAELCRKEGINQNLYYRWSKEFLEAGKKRLAGAAIASQ